MSAAARVFVRIVYLTLSSANWLPAFSWAADPKAAIRRDLSEVVSCGFSRSREPTFPIRLPVDGLTDGSVGYQAPHAACSNRPKTSRLRLLGCIHERHFLFATDLVQPSSRTNFSVRSRYSAFMSPSRAPNR